MKYSIDDHLDFLIDHKKKKNKACCAKCAKHGSGIVDTALDTGAEMFIRHGIPWLGKKAVETGRYMASEAIRSPRVKKAITNKAKQLSHKGLDYVIDSLSSDVINKASDKLRPKGYRKGSGLYADWYPMELYTDTLDPTNPLYRGEGFDLHKFIGKLPRPKKGFVPPGMKYCGPYNPLEKQLKYDPDTGKILEIYEKPTGRSDAVCMQHDVDYSVCGDDRKCKGEADRKMVSALDAIPWKERNWGHAAARNIINTKQKLGLGGAVSKNVRGRRLGKRN